MPPGKGLQGHFDSLERLEVCITVKAVSLIVPQRHQKDGLLELQDLEHLCELRCLVIGQNHAHNITQIEFVDPVRIYRSALGYKSG
jgi:hypothetical protein